MKKCVYCKKIMTDNEEQATMHNFDYTYAIDADYDKKCDSCDARCHAQACIRAISVDMQTIRDIAKKEKIVQPEVFLGKKLTSIQDYWIKHFTEQVDEKPGGYWRIVFDGHVRDKTEYLAFPVKFEKEVLNKNKGGGVL